MWNSFLKAGQPHGMQICALDSMDIRRIEAGILNNGSDMDETMTPYEAGLGHFVDLAKADFIGKAALQKKPAPARLTGLKCPGGEPLREGAVTANGEKVGFVTAGAWSPYLGSGTAIVRLAGAMAPGSRVEVLCRDGKMHAAEIAAFPFYDKEGKIQRGLESSIPSRNAAE
jgi:aminomethyltransferase